MIIVMRHGASRQEVDQVVKRIAEEGLTSHLSEGADRVVVGVIGSNPFAFRDVFVQLPGVLEVIPITKPYKLSGREWHAHDSVFDVDGLSIGGEALLVIAGPCSVESEEMLLETARAVRAAGAHVLRGGAFKPRTSPYSFQGLGADGLRFLAKARQATGLKVVSEVLTPSDVELVGDTVDIVQIGARNMQNFALLQAVGQLRKPVLLKRGMSATVEEWLLSAEYVLSQGNYQVILCERGIRTFETYTRNTLDLSAVPLLRSLTHLPVVVDPSHGTGRAALVPPMALAAVAAGAHGIMLEVHPHPDHALSDGPQSLTPEGFRQLMDTLRPVAAAVGRKLAPAGGTKAAAR
jgi:3-deoxy-7-phosphoheptulonate synthase